MGKQVRLQVWPVAADGDGIWLLDREPWRSGTTVPSGNPIHGEVELVLMSRGAHARTLVIHSTSWHDTPYAMVVTYLAVVGVDGPVKDFWPDAYQVDPALVDEVGRPEAHDPNEAPDPRHLDVLLHALGHLNYLARRNLEIRTRLPAVWHRHLAVFAPTLAELYETSVPYETAVRDAP